MCWGEREFCANIPGGVSSQEKPKPQLAQRSLSTKDHFLLLFIHLNLVELDGSVGCCVEMGCFRLDLLSLGNDNVFKLLSCSWLLPWPIILCGVQLPKARAALPSGTVNYLGCGVGGRGTKL